MPTSTVFRASVCCFFLSVTSVSAAAASTSPEEAAHVWLTPTPLPIQASLIVSEVIQGESPLSGVVSAAASARDDLEKARVEVRDQGTTGLCPLSKSANVINALERTDGILALILLEATDPKNGEDPTADLLGIINAGTALARCNGGVGPLSVGASMREKSREVARFLGERGQLSDKSLQVLAARLSSTTLTLDDMIQAIARSQKSFVSTLELLADETRGPIFDLGATQVLIDRHFREMAVAARENRPGWMEKFETRRNALLTDEDARALKAIKKLAQGRSQAAMFAAAKMVEEPIPPNLVGRMVARDFLRIVVDVSDTVDVDQVHTNAFAVGAALLALTRANKPPPVAEAPVTVTHDSVRATVHGKTHSWKLRLNEPFNL